MIYTDQDGSVWISGQMVCKDAFPLFPMTAWLPILHPNPFVLSGYVTTGALVSGYNTVVGSGGTLPVTSGARDQVPHVLGPPDQLNPFYHGYDSLE